MKRQGQRGVHTSHPLPWSPSPCPTLWEEGNEPIKGVGIVQPAVQAGDRVALRGAQALAGTWPQLGSAGTADLKDLGPEPGERQPDLLAVTQGDTWVPAWGKPCLASQDARKQN